MIRSKLLLDYVLSLNRDQNIGALNLRNDYFPIQKIQVTDISGVSADWATNSQQDYLNQVQTLHKQEKKNY